tara:strand:+ start:1045 stop:1353 length:309 start_codon:yes stop_codon:yes gene_type:complete
MNKSLAIKNRFYLFISLVLSFFFFLYLLYVLINGERGLISFYKIKNQTLFYEEKIADLEYKNFYLIDRTTRLQPNSLDLDYLDELIRYKTGLIEENEVIFFY